MIHEFNVTQSRKQFYIMILLLIVIPCLLYYPSLSYDFLYELDDDWIVISNNSIRMMSLYGIKKGLTYLFFYDTTDFHYHPITYLSYSLDYLLFGINSIEIKLHNLFLHIISGLLVFYFINLLTKNRWISFTVSLLFLIHPMNIESIAWISCRRQSLFFCYFLGSIIAYKHFLENQNKTYRVCIYLLSIILWIIAMLAKASAIVAPAIFVLLYIHKHRDSINIKTIINHLLPMLPIMAFIVDLNEQANARNYLVREFSYSNLDHLIFAGYTYFFYWAKGLFPFPLVIFYPAPSEHLPHLPIQYFAMFASSILLLCLLFYHFIKKQNTLFFALGFYTFTILPMINLIYYPLGDLPMLVANRYFYHISIGIFLYIVLLINYSIKNTKIKFSLASIYFLILIILFRIHLPVWRNQITIYENNVKYYPSEEVLYKLAITYDNIDNKKAFDYLEKADKLGTDIWINYPWPYYQGRSRLYLKAGKYKKALNDIDIALKKSEGKTQFTDSILEIDKSKILEAMKMKM